jgi:two-component system chemotaxis sensor kinase CheA
MSFDLNEFLDMFFEEVAEHLGMLERIFLEMNASGSAAADDIDTAFRAAHSIKGGAGTFGFSEVQSLAHALENALDAIRKGNLAISDRVITVFLEALDALQAALDERKAGGSVDEQAHNVLIDDLNALIKDTQKGTSREADKKAKPPSPQGEKSSVKPSDPGEEGGKFYRITLPGLTEPVAQQLLEAFEQVGKIVSRETQEDTLVIEIQAAAPPSMLIEVIAFYTDPKPAKIEEIPEATKAGGEQGSKAADDKTKLSPLQESPKDTTAIEGEDFGFFDDAAEASKQDKQDIAQQESQKKASSVQEKTKTLEDKGQNPRLQKQVGRPQHAEISSIRVDVQKVDQLVNLVGEFVIAQAMLMDALKKLDHAVVEKLSDVLDVLQQRSSELQETVLSVRMLPVGTVFSRLPRVVHDLSRKLGKEVNLEVYGEETELDKGMIEALIDPLTHLVRNCLDHGIEMPDERINRGKPRRGTIEVRAAHEGGGIVIEVKDDGAGLDRQKLLSKARERGLVPPEKNDDEFSDEQVYAMIMMPGFSTASVVTEVSGRGVGMDVVKKNVEQLGGRVQIESAPGQGTTFILRLPLTLAIIDGMLVSVGEEVYVVPLTTILESLKIDPSHLKTVASRGRMLRVRGEYLPVIHLAELFNIPAKARDMADGIAVIVDAQGKKTALVVDDLFGQTQVVVKSLSQNFKKIAGFAGATILGNGKVTLILDCAGLLSIQQDLTEA